LHHRVLVSETHKHLLQGTSEHGHFSHQIYFLHEPGPAKKSPRLLDLGPTACGDHFDRLRNSIGSLPAKHQNWFANLSFAQDKSTPFASFDYSSLDGEHDDRLHFLLVVGPMRQ
jgi:hypothetical protein